MNFENFVDEVKNGIKGYLSEGYDSAAVEVMPYEKLNEKYLSMVVRGENQMLAPTINLDMYYQRMQDRQEDIGNIMKQMAEIIESAPAFMNIECLLNYEKAKERLFIRVSNAEKNADLLRNLPYTQMEDLAITYHIAADINIDGVASSMITNQMLQTFGVTKEQLHQDALENSPRLFPPKIDSMDHIMEEMMRADLKAAGFGEKEIEKMIAEVADGFQNPMVVVTNDQQVNGAAVLFYPGQMEQIGEKLKEDFFILPSSTHEVLVLPDDGEMNYRDLKQMVMDVNTSEVSPEERLADDVYHYDVKEKIFEKADRYENRQKQKEKEHPSVGVKDQQLQLGSKPKHKSSQIAL